MLEERISTDVKEAMKAKNKIAVMTLRSLKTAILNKKIADQLNRDDMLPDHTVQGLLKTELKRRHEAAEAFEKGGNDEAAASERAEAEIIENYLPQQLTDEELKLIVSEVITNHPGAHFGVLMKEVMIKADGRADGRRIKEEIEKQS